MKEWLKTFIVWSFMIGVIILGVSVLVWGGAGLQSLITAAYSDTHPSRIHEGRIESLPAECQYVGTVFDYEVARCEFSEDVCYVTPGGHISCIGGKP